MTEIISKVGLNKTIELVTDTGAMIATVPSMQPYDAAYLARGMLACASALSGTNPPSPGTWIGDAHHPVMRWAVGSSAINGELVLILSIPSGPQGIELTFQMPAQGAKELAAALMKQVSGVAPPNGQAGTVH